MKKYLFTIVLISLIGLWPFFKNGFFKTHDGEWMIIRFTAFHQTLASGQIPVRFVDRLANNYGYPVINFLYPLPFYISEIFKTLGFNFTSSIKMTLILSTLASSVFMYWALREKFSAEAALAGSVIYLFAPYRFVDLYVRGSIGENIAFVFLPLILGSVYKIKKNKRVFLPILSLSIAGLILSHNVLAFIFLPVLLIMTLLIIQKKIETLLYYLLGLLISAFFWIPAIYDLRFVRFSQFNISTINDHLVTISKLIIPSWGYGSTPNTPDGLSVQIGLVSQIVVLVVIFKRIKYMNRNLIIDFIILLFFISSFMMTNYSKFIWAAAPIEKLIQFPWRLLSVTVFAIAFLTAYLVDSNKKKLLFSFLIITGSIATTIFYTKPSAFINYPEGYYTTNEDSTTVKDEYLPIWVKVKPQQRAVNKIELIKGESDIKLLNLKSSNYSFTADVKKESQLQINTYYFPGWQIESNGKKININNPNKNGLINFTLPAGFNKVVVKYGKTPVHLMSEIVTITALFMCLFILLKYRKSI